MEVSRYLIDTSAYSLFRRGHGEIVDEISAAMEIVFSPVVLAELRAGFIVGSRRQQNEQVLTSFLQSQGVRVIEIDAATSFYYAEINLHLHRSGLPIPHNDLWIAASAMQHGLQILTADSHFRHVPQVIVREFSIH